MSIAKLDTEFALKIVVGRVRYRAQRHAIPNTYCPSVAEATQRMSDTQFSGCRMASQSSEISRLAFINLYKSSELTSEAWIAYAIPEHKYFNESPRVNNRC